MAQKLPNMAQNYPKWPKNDEFTHFFRNFFLTEKDIPQTFSLLECMKQTDEKQTGVKQAMKSNPVSTARLLLIWRIPQNMELMDRRLDSIRTTAAAQIRYLAIGRLNHGNGIVLNHRSQSSDGLTHSNTVLQ